MSGFESAALRVMGVLHVDETLYVVAHTKKMHTDLPGAIQIRQKTSKSGMGNSQCTFYVIPLHERRAKKLVSFTLRQCEECSQDSSLHVPVTQSRTSLICRAAQLELKLILVVYR